MSTIVTLNIFSGRPNPRWFLDDAAAAELRDRIYGKPTMISAAPPNPGALGYRGLEIRFDDSAEPIHIQGGVIRTLAGSPNLVDPDREIEKFVINTMPEGGRDAGMAMTQNVHGLMREHIEKELAAKIDLSKLIKWPWPPIIWKCPANVAACAPPYEPAMWNFSPTQPNNNCYNYANDRVTNTFAQPGKYHSAQYTALTCASVQPAAVADGLVAASNFTQSIPDGWYVALVIWPNVDFHWYRQDKVGCWSHKPGSTPVKNTDDSNNPITDPKTANRGGYTQFCSYMITRPCKVRIK
jgi:hypothetical protein